MINGITFGICTYNRKGILEKSAKSLALVNGIENIHIRVYDDYSTEYDENFLKALFPNAEQICVQPQNGGADKNTALMYEDFLKSGDEWLFNADSDLIYRTDILDAIERFSEQCDGFMTFFNCINHNTVETVNNELIVKDSVGAAGCLLRKDVVQFILDNTKSKRFGFDVGYCKLLRENGRKLFATNESYVQHIGVSGFNSRNIIFDYGENFICDSAVNAAIIESTAEEYIRVVEKYRKTASWKVYNFVVSVPRRVKKVIWLATQK